MISRCRQAQKAAAEAEAERRRTVSISKEKAGVVEPEFPHRGAQNPRNPPASTGNRPQKTTGWAGLKPGQRFCGVGGGRR
jgi:hypothetical protein